MTDDPELATLTARAVADLEIDQPIYAARIVGNLLELKLPHGTATWPIPERTKLEDLTVEHLKELARQRGIENWNRLRKAQLIAALKDH